MREIPFADILTQNIQNSTRYSETPPLNLLMAYLAFFYQYFKAKPVITA
jgi:hypothetical protein